MITIYRGLLENLGNTDDDTNELCNIFTAYMFYRLCLSDENIKKIDAEITFNSLVQDMWKLVFMTIKGSDSTRSKQHSKLINCLKTNLHILAWVFFQRGMLSMTQEIADIMPDDGTLECRNAEVLATAIFLSINKKDKNVNGIIGIAKEMLAERLKGSGILQ